MKSTTVVTLFLSMVLCSSVVSANPIKPMFEEAIRAYSAKDYKTAIAILEKINEIYPSFAPTYNYLGLCYKESGSSGEDIKWLFEKAIEIDPNYADPYDNLAKLYYAMTDFEKAEENGLKAVELNPDFATAHLTLGWIYLLGKSQPADAIEHFDKITGQNSDIPYAQFGLGMAYHMEHQSFRVLEMVTKLRQAGREDLAQQLEGVIRSGKYQTDLVPGMPLIAQPRAEVAVKEDQLTFTDDEETKKVPVRLGTAPVNSEPAQQLTSDSPQERLRALRRRGMQAQGR